MSDDAKQSEPEFDPFATPGDGTADAAPAADEFDDANGDDVLNEGGDEFDDLLDEIDLDEEESADAVKVRDSRAQYSDPRDVGLKDKMWVPIRVLTAEVIEKHVPRLSSKTCIARKDGKTYVLYDQVEAALRVGAEETIAEVPLPYFICTANHEAPGFGQRRFDYEIEVPVFTVKTAYYKPQRSGRTGYMNEDGRSLRQATNATAAGDRVTKASMADVADKMVDTIIMAQLSVTQSKKPKFRDILDEGRNPVNVLVDPESGAPVLVFRPEGSSDYVFEETGELFDGDEKLLFPATDRKFAIRDNGESSDVLKERYYPFNDYVNAPFKPVPDRKASVEMLSGDTIDGEITWDTVGVVVHSKTPGAIVNVLLRTGKTVPAVWLGTQWNEVEKDGDGLDEFKGA